MCQAFASEPQFMSASAANTDSSIHVGRKEKAGEDLDVWLPLCISIFSAFFSEVCKSIAGIGHTASACQKTWPVNCTNSTAGRTVVWTTHWGEVPKPASRIRVLLEAVWRAAMPSGVGYTMPNWFTLLWQNMALALLWSIVEEWWLSVLTAVTFYNLQLKARLCFIRNVRRRQKKCQGRRRRLWSGKYQCCKSW